MNFSNTFVLLGDAFYQKIRPTRVNNPRLFLWNSNLANDLRISEKLKHDVKLLSQVFSGNYLLPGTEPIATAYAGHQFGQFVPQLGDGRAHLLGEIVDKFGRKKDIQLKGSGPTKFSRNGDGRCALGPAVREFVMSEAMHALGVPTTRCLAVVTTGETIFREVPKHSAVVTRIASSHLRIGTFQFFAAKNNYLDLERLVNYAINRLYPKLKASNKEDLYIKFVDKIVEKQIKLVTEWMRVGFIHGVMNTDNISISGETIDYGPCAMMDVYDPKTVYSSIDVDGRYAFGNQPAILQWNLERFVECILLLANFKETKEKLYSIISNFHERFKQAYVKMIRGKLGLDFVLGKDQQLISYILDQIRNKSLDYTNTFDLLTRSLTSEKVSQHARQKLGTTFDFWRKRLNEQNINVQKIQNRMRKYNPLIIPRNHNVEVIIKNSEKTKDATSVENFLRVVRSPYQETEETTFYQEPPINGDKNYKTFCGT